MKVSPETLAKFAAIARQAAADLASMADDLDAAAADNISPGDVNLQGCYAAAQVVREVTPFMERV